MDYKQQVYELVNYFRKHEKEERDFSIGVEFEHFIIDKNTLRTISYYGTGGVEETLKELEKQGWQGNYEGDYLLGLDNNNKHITLEPGSQMELSISPQKDIQDLEKEYLSFLTEILPILEKKNQGLIAIGYHPISKIQDIKMIPKERYNYMYEYFKTRGTHAHNMMKGTASVQIAIDYSSEEDYIKKFKIANALSPILYILFDNGYYFEGEVWDRHNLRSFIWENCDSDRSGIVPSAFDNDYGYEKYAEYILNVPPILIINNGNTCFTGNKMVKEIFNPDNYSTDELEHILTMVFPDVRTKKYIEIRMIDSIPYPLNFAAVALIKGIFYNEYNLNTIYEHVKDINIDDIIKSKSSVAHRGLNGQLKEENVLDIGKWIVKLAKNGLDSAELKYIKPLDDMLENNKNPYEIIRERYNLGIKESLNWCILENSIVKTFK